MSGRYKVIALIPEWTSSTGSLNDPVVQANSVTDAVLRRVSMLGSPEKIADGTRFVVVPPMDGDAKLVRYNRPGAASATVVQT